MNCCKKVLQNTKFVLKNAYKYVYHLHLGTTYGLVISNW